MIKFYTKEGKVMQELIINDKDLFVMNLVHYFITEKNYNPIIIHGISDEIWLENLENDYKVIRIISKHIHNNEQLGFDKFKLNQIIKKLKVKTLSLKMDVLNIYTDLGDNVSLEKKDLFISSEDEIKNDTLIEIFPDIVEKTKHGEDGLNLFLKITDDINITTTRKNKIADKIFSKKYPLITYIIIGINILMFIYSLFANYDVIAKYGMSNFFIKQGEYYRLFTCMFLHENVIHILFNMYALYVLGPQIESFFGKWKFLFIYLISGLCGSLLSFTFNIDVISVGASGAIFGLLGSMLYFGYHYRTYLGNVVKSQIIPIIVFNLILGFTLKHVNNFGHIGGLIGGVLTSMIVGVPDKKNKIDRVNGIIIIIIYFAFLLYLNFYR